MSAALMGRNVVINDGFGDSAPPADEVVENFDNWVKRTAYKICAPNHLGRLDDVCQEGRLTLWQTYGRDADLPINYRYHRATQAADKRMRDFAYGRRLQTGHTHNANGSTGDVEVTTSLDKPVLEGDKTLADLLASVEALEGVEWAYHHGEIMAALSALTPKQRQYVYARFWCGMDTSGGIYNNPGVKAARKANPILTRDNLWTGNKTTKGAKERLAEALAHLHDLVRT